MDLDARQEDKGAPGCSIAASWRPLQLHEPARSATSITRWLRKGYEFESTRVDLNKAPAVSGIFEGCEVWQRGQRIGRDAEILTNRCQLISTGIGGVSKLALRSDIWIHMAQSWSRDDEIDKAAICWQGPVIARCDCFERTRGRIRVSSITLRGGCEHSEAHLPGALRNARVVAEFQF